MLMFNLLIGWIFRSSKSGNSCSLVIIIIIISNLSIIMLKFQKPFCFLQFLNFLTLCVHLIINLFRIKMSNILYPINVEMLLHSMIYIIQNFQIETFNSFHADGSHIHKVEDLIYYVEYLMYKFDYLYV